jgi:hypothetical protein
MGAKRFRQRAMQSLQKLLQHQIDVDVAPAVTR